MPSGRYHPWKPSEPTPTYAEAIAVNAFKGTEEQWHQLTPGYRREIVRTVRKIAGSTTT